MFLTLMNLILTDGDSMVLNIRYLKPKVNREVFATAKICLRLLKLRHLQRLLNSQIAV